MNYYWLDALPDSAGLVHPICHAQIKARRMPVLAIGLADGLADGLAGWMPPLSHLRPVYGWVPDGCIIPT